MGRPGTGLRVLMAGQYLDPQAGGAERYAHEVGTRLAALPGFELRRLAGDGSSGVSPAALRLWTTGYHPAWPRQVRALLDRTDPQVLYVHHTVPGLTDVVLRQAAARGIPVALMYHSDVTGPQRLKRLVGRAYGGTIGRASLAVPAIVFVSSATYVARSPILRRLRAEFVEAPPGVDPAMAAGRRGDARYLLFVGKPDVPTKGFAVLLAAWRRVRDDWPDHELRVVGDGGEAPPATAERVRFLGRVTSRARLADLYAGADATVLPSLTHESFGMVLAESLVAGCPIVASDIGGIPALVDDGRNGRLVPPGDVAALAAALRDLLANGAAYREHVAREREGYRRRFSWDATAGVVARALTELATAGVGRPARPTAGEPA